MAISILLQPTEIKSCDIPILFRVTTDSTDVTTEIQAQIYYRRNQDEFYTLAAKQMQQKASGQNYFEFNIASVCEKLLTSDYQTISTGFVTNIENSSIEVILKFSEYYPSSLFVVHDTTATGVYQVCNTKLYPSETQSVGVGTDWYMDAAGSHKFLTDSPASVPIRASERIQLGLLTSYTDPIIKVKETKTNLSTATVTYELPNATFNRYLWNYTVDASEVITIITDLPSTAAFFITNPTGTSSFKYMADNLNKMWGGIEMVGNNDYCDIDLPNLTVATATLVWVDKAITSNNNYEIYYYYSAAWHASALNPITSGTSGYTTETETIPANSTAVRIKKISATGKVWIPYMYVSYVDDNVINNRCQFALDTTHIDSDTLKLEIWAETTVSSNSIMSEVKTFLVDSTPTAQDTTRFAVKNKRGDFDHFTYTQMHSEILTAEKVRSTKELPNTYTNKDRGTSVAKVVSEKIFTCYSEFIEEADLQWWATIIESDEVFVIVSDVQYSVDIITSSVISDTHTDLVQLKIDWSYSVKR